GGGSGKVIVPGSADQSRLYKLVSHQETPHMPPMQSKLEDPKLELIRKWIDAGAPIDKNAKPVASAMRTEGHGAAGGSKVRTADPTLDPDTAPMPAGLAKGPIHKPLHPLPASAMAI